MVWPFRKREDRGQLTPAVAQNSTTEFAERLGLFDFLLSSSADIEVTPRKALGVPAVWAAVNFIAGTIAGLPLKVYRRRRDGSREVVRTGIAPILHDAVNDTLSSFAWRKYTFERVLIGGRGLTFIERAPNGRVLNLWPLDPARVTIREQAGRRTYEYRNPDGRVYRYEAADIIDLPFMVDADGLSHVSPITICRDAIALSIASTAYAGKFFHGGGVPPFMITGGFQSGSAMQRAADDLESAVRKASQERRQALVLPAGLEVKPIGGNPEQNQLIEAKRFAVEEIARIYSLPPVFLQDLTHGTFSNTEQQDLHFVKHTLKRWIEQAEQEMNLKLFGRGASQYVEFSVDGLLRGDFKTRMEGHALAIQHGIETPDEARGIENRPPLQGGVGGQGWMQGAMMPMDRLPMGQNSEGEDGV